eukprot:CAMPEP_0179164360 /NCGR_PEP_ID=MMETSP0796-20121207/80651_1 /TAXON_ID=73915 /ORGANISM="Pyrodinium bahamense, Strain pbaha01" /LENGTH=32 /DNA_ID= /DNA_START= /DNA_END= /DNA_ORIENTATION=
MRHNYTNAIPAAPEPAIQNGRKGWQRWFLTSA